MVGTEHASGVVSATLETDQPGEMVRLQHAHWLSGVTFWTVTGSLRHWAMHHDSYVASLVIGPSPELRATWQSRGEERIAQRGSVQLMVPGEAHRTTAVSEPASFFVLWWTPAAMAEAARQLDVAGSVHFSSPQLERASAAAALGRLHQAVNRGGSRLEIEGCYIESTAQLLEHGTERGGKPSRLPRCHPSVRRALEVMHDLFAQNISLDDLSRETRVSKFHLSRCFRENTGLAPHQYQKLLRLQAARRLIETGVSVRDAADRSGFADTPHLTRHFRTWLGVSPGQWARASRLSAA